MWRLIGTVALAMALLAVPTRLQAAGGRPVVTPSGRTARHYATEPPGSRFFPQYVPDASSTSGPSPSFRWGYFGARSAPHAYGQTSFYGEHSNWFGPRQ